MIRPYGPGKFDTILDGYVYALSLDGSSEECGDAATTNHFCLVHLGRGAMHAIRDEAARDGDRLTLDEAELLRSHHGAIVEENDQGFVRITYFKTARALERKWRQIEAAVAGEEGGE